MQQETTEVDVAIVGAGPAGLCLAHALAGTGLAVALVERQTAEALASPAFDGREIALSHASIARLQALGVWQRFDAADISELRDARVMNGTAPDACMDITARLAGREALGALVPNHRIRRAAYEAARANGHIHWLTGRSVAALATTPAGARLVLDDGSAVAARLAVSADSRFSATRRMMGIGARLRDFGKTMMVCRMTHERPHDHVATEWFDYGQTVALLPLNGNQVSVVLTLPHREIEPLLALDDADFAAHIEERLQHRLGAMQVASTRHAYPLVAAYAERFTGTRHALVGDAAVGMHPVTAHGFNLGLESVDLLATAVTQAACTGGDIAAPGLLAGYERRLRLATRPLYLATNMVVSLFTNDLPPARWARQAVLTAASRLRPFRQIIAWQLTRSAAG